MELLSSKIFLMFHKFQKSLLIKFKDKLGLHTLNECLAFFFGLKTLKIKNIELDKNEDDNIHK